MTEIAKRELLDTLENGNISAFRKSVKKMRKIDMLDLIEYSQGQHNFPRHVLINSMRLAFV